MNRLLRNDSVRELLCENNFSYILEDSALFQTTEFKVICHQHNSVFVEIIKMMLNGKIQIYYLTGKYMPLDVAIKEIKVFNLWSFITEIFSSLLEIKKDGFLSIGNVLTDMNHIFVEPATNKIKWIYLPISNDLYKNEAVFEKEVISELKRGLKRLLNAYDAERVAELIDEDLALEQVIARLKNGSAIDRKRKNQSNTKIYLKIQAIDKDNPVVLIDDRDEFLIGRKASAVDGLVTSSKLIGRVHCKIIRNGYSFSVVDLQSTNGTFINGVKIRPNEMTALSDGDILCLAKEKFSVSVEEGEDANS